MTEAFRWVITTYGQAAVCYDRKGRERSRAMAIVRPMTEKDWQVTAGALGKYRTDRFLCLAQPYLETGRMGDGGWLTWGGKDYEVMAVQPIHVCGQLTHLRMVLRPAEEGAV